MKKEDELLKELTDMVKETKKGQLKWKLTCKTTEYGSRVLISKYLMPSGGKKTRLVVCLLSQAV